MLEANWLIFALVPKVELDAETLVLHSRLRFLCFVVHFYKYFWFWYQTQIVSEIVYAVIWPSPKLKSTNFTSLISLLLPPLFFGRGKVEVWDPWEIFLGGNIGTLWTLKRPRNKYFHGGKFLLLVPAGSFESWTADL